MSVLSSQVDDHTKLMNVLIMLGYPNMFINPVLLNCGYPLKQIALKIPIPEYDPSKRESHAGVPDAAYSSKEKNSVLFLEAKTGGVEHDQLDRFLFIQQNPSTLIRTPNNLDLQLKDIILDFGIVCTDMALRQCS